MFQAAPDGENTEFPGRYRYARSDRARQDPRAYRDITTETTARPVGLARPKLRNTIEECWVETQRL